MVSSGKVSCIVFVMHLLLRVMCVLMHVHVLVGVNVSVIMCILVWIHVHVCVAPPIVVGAWPMAGTLWRLFEYYYPVDLTAAEVDNVAQLLLEERYVSMQEELDNEQLFCILMHQRECVALFRSYN